MHYMEGNMRVQILQRQEGGKEEFKIKCFTGALIIATERVKENGGACSKTNGMVNTENFGN